MLLTAGILSGFLFLAFAAAGFQKVIFNPMMSEAAEHLGFSKPAYQRIGVLELAGALGLVVGIAAHRNSFWGVLNIAAAAGLALTMILAVTYHLRKGDGTKLFAPAIVLGVLSVLELIFRLN